MKNPETSPPGPAEQSTEATFGRRFYDEVRRLEGMSPITFSSGYRRIQELKQADVEGVTRWLRWVPRSVRDPIRTSSPEEAALLYVEWFREMQRAVAAVVLIVSLLWVFW